MKNVFLILVSLLLSVGCDLPTESDIEDSIDDYFENLFNSMYCHNLEYDLECNCEGSLDTLSIEGADTLLTECTP